MSATAPRQVLETRPSALRWLWPLATHLVAAIALFVAQPPPPARLAGLVALAISLGAGRRQAVPTRLRLDPDGRLQVWRDATWRPAQVLAGSVAWPWLIVLRWRENGRYHSLPLPPDALSADAHRRLRVWLRWKAGGAAAGLK